MITLMELITLIAKLSLRLIMLNLSLCDYSDANILVKGTITVPNTAAPCQLAKVNVINWAPLTDYISEINNMRIDNAKNIDEGRIA